MKTRRRVLAVISAVVMILSMMTIGASASHIDTSFENFDVSFFGYSELTPRDKENNTTTYLYYTTGTRTTVKVRVIGCSDNLEDTNVTYSNGQPADYVTCAKGVKYSIHNRVYEDGFTQAKLGFKSPNLFGDTITGVWSPDSLYTYTSATT